MQINNLSIIPNWRFSDKNGRHLHASLLSLLGAIDKHKKLTAAAEDCKLSYRHAWNILQEAEVFFGSPVTLKERGRGAKLTALGKVLLQANQRIDARLHTQMESLAMELNAEVHKVISDEIGVMAIYASHGYAVALIPKYMPDYQAELHYHGSEDALKALQSGSCKVAGFTVPLHHRIEHQQRRYQSLLHERDVKILRFIKRQQGLMLPAGNPKGIKSLDDLADKEARLINRQPNSGTRELLSALLEERGIRTKTVVGFDQYEYTHTAVAAQVATGMADVGFGMQAAAARFDLDFIPMTEDLYLWAVRSDSFDDPEVSRFIKMLGSKEFQKEVNDLPGYECDDAGQIASLKQLF